MSQRLVHGHTQVVDKKEEEKKPTIWESGLEKISGCGRVSDFIIVLDQAVHEKIAIMMLLVETHRDGKEWLAYMIGELSTDEGIVHDLVIPPQEVTTASVDVKPGFEMPEGVIGVFHSHGSMGSFFSGTDEKYINANHKISVVANKSLEYKGTATLESPCGKLVVLPDIKVVVQHKVAIIEASMQDMTKIEVSKPVYGGQGRFWPSAYGGGDKEFWADMYGMHNRQSPLLPGWSETTSDKDKADDVVDGKGRIEIGDDGEQCPVCMGFEMTYKKGTKDKVVGKCKDCGAELKVSIDAMAKYAVLSEPML